MKRAPEPDLGGQWDRRYQEHGWSDTPDVPLVELSHSLTPGTALDLGGGTGRNALALARSGWEVTIVDASRVGLEFAQTQATKEGLRLHQVQADPTNYRPSPLSYDLVVVANIHLDPSERDAFFAEAARAVRPGGHLYVIGHHVDALGVAGPPDAARLFDLETFKDRFHEFRELRHERQRESSDATAPSDVVVLWWGQKVQPESTSS